uniref:Uncharacterized protein n=1 Tax=Peronospora matthiolae TaxID=2874970 RepID=A0AAV1UGS6_9STRA
MFTAAHLYTDSHTERVTQSFEYVLRCFAMSISSWSAFLLMAEFAMNNAAHTITGLTLFSQINARHPRTLVLVNLLGTSKPGEEGTQCAMASMDAAVTNTAADSVPSFRPGDDADGSFPL